MPTWRTSSLRYCIGPPNRIELVEKGLSSGIRQINKGQERIHDALEFPDGKVVLLTRLYEGQEATVLQLPAETRVP
jgi:hypothetical protein